MAIALGALLTSQIVARSEAVVRGPVEQRMDDLAYRLNGRISVGSMVPAGVWGVELRDVEFRPHTVAPLQGDFPLATIDAIRLYPDLGAVVDGTARIRRVLIDNPRVVAILDSDGSPHTDWIDWLTHELRSRRAPVGAAVGPSGDSVLTFPDVVVRGGYVTLDDPSGRYPSMGTRFDELMVGPDPDDDTSTSARVAGSLTIEGLGPGLIDGRFGGGEEPRIALRFMEDNDVFPLLPFEVEASADAQLSVGAVEFDWPPHAVLRDVNCSGLDAPIPGLSDRRLDQVVGGSMTISVDAEGFAMETRDIVLRIASDAGAIDFQMSAARLNHPWAAEATTAELELTDDDGDPLSVWFDRTTDEAVLSARARASDFDVAPLLRLLPEAAPAHAAAGSFSGSVEGEWNPAESAMRAVVSGAVEQLSVDAPLLSGETLHGIGVGVELTATWWPDGNNLLVERARVLVPAIGLSARGSAGIEPGRLTLEVSAFLPPRPAQDLLRALPYGMVPVLHGFRLDGNFGFEGRLSLDTADLDGLEADVSFDTDDLRIVQFGPLAPMDRLLDSDFTWRVHNFEGGTRRVGPGTGEWVSISEIPNHVYRSVVAAEDDRFWIHNGLDEMAILSAFRANLEAGRVVRGGSTISQQVVKNFFLDHERTLARKLQEAFLTWQLEQLVSKEAILEIYLNLVHWGPGIYGVRQASLGYFDHLPEQLSLRESIFLASILPNPALFGEQYTRRIIPPSRRQKMEHILANLHGAGYLSRQSLRHHTRMVSEGRISHTPPPQQLGSHRGLPASVEPRLGALFVMP